MVYIHTDIQWEETSVFLFVLSQSVQGECFPQRRRAYGSKVKVLCCEISLYSFILYIWCAHFSHLLGLSHLQVLSLSSSWRSLQYSSVCLQEHRQVAGSCTNKRFLLSEQWSQHGSQTLDRQRDRQRWGGRGRGRLSQCTVTTRKKGRP